MATKKVTITLEAEQVEQVRMLVDAGRAASVSGFVQHAVAVALDDVAGSGGRCWRRRSRRPAAPSPPMRERGQTLHSAAATVVPDPLAAVRVAGYTGNPPDILETTDDGASFTQVPGAVSGGQMTPYAIDTNGVPGTFGVAGDFGRITIYDSVAGVWQTSAPTGQIIVGLMGIGNHWVAIAAAGEWWYSTNNGASWTYSGGYLNYASGFSILTVHAAEAANGVWMATGYDTLATRTIWRATSAAPTNGASGFFGGSSGEFSLIQATGTANLVTIYGIGYGGAGNVWYAAGNFGDVFRSTDNGASFSTWRNNFPAINYDVSTNPDTDTVIVASSQGLYRWIAGVDASAGLPGGIWYAVAYAGDNTWVAAGDVGKISVSHDDGATWSPAAVPHGAAIYNQITVV
ncbi:MAG: hypothetical protein JJU45_16985 [Acidimicrobiia bacterium]|nr:hypothetical protein [Acidimicrobiia bacterium]